MAPKSQVSENGINLFREEGHTRERKKVTINKSPTYVKNKDGWKPDQRTNEQGKQFVYRTRERKSLLWSNN